MLSQEEIDHLNFRTELYRKLGKGPLTKLEKDQLKKDREFDKESARVRAKIRKEEGGD